MHHESKCDEEENECNRSITRMGSAGVLQVSAKERSRVFKQQRQLSLQRRNQLNFSCSNAFAVDHDGNGTKPIMMRNFSAPKGALIERNRRVTAPEKESLKVLNETSENRRKTIPISMKEKDDEDRENKELSDSRWTSEKVKDIPERKTLASSDHDESKESEMEIYNSQFEYPKNTQSQESSLSSTDNIDPSANFKLTHGVNLDENRLVTAELGIETHGFHGNHSTTEEYSTASSPDEKPTSELDLNNPEDLKEFVMRPTVSQLQCYIHRSKKSVLNNPEYCVYLKNGDQFLMYSKKRSKKKTSNYLIRTARPNVKDYQYEDTENHQDPSIVGKLRANFLGTEFTIYDSGANPIFLDSDDNGDFTETVRSEIGGIVYEKNVLGSKGPRKMRVCINKLDDITEKPMKKWQPIHSDEQMLTAFKNEMASPLSSFLFKMINKPPQWNDQLEAFVLNFNGRVTMASVKNFQLIEERKENFNNEGSNDDRIILQFGRVSKDEFTMDLDWPLSPMQALCICLSSFDSKLACD